jgi:hypothetical protein
MPRDVSVHNMANTRPYAAECWLCVPNCMLFFPVQFSYPSCKLISLTMALPSLALTLPNAVRVVHGLLLSFFRCRMVKSYDTSPVLNKSSHRTCLLRSDGVVWGDLEVVPVNRSGLTLYARGHSTLHIPAQNKM